MTVTGRSRPFERHLHAERGFGAIYELARIIDAFRRELREDKLTFNVGLVGGGATAELDPGQIRLEATGKTNIIPATAVARGDLRAHQPRPDRPRQGEDARRSSRSRFPAPRPRSTFDADGYPPMAPTDGNRALLDRLNLVNRDMGLAEMGELDPVKRGAGDISFVAADVDGLVGLGTASDGDHAPGETVDIPSIFKQAKRAAILMSRLAREKSSARLRLARRFRVPAVEGDGYPVLLGPVGVNPMLHEARPH